MRKTTKSPGEKVVKDIKRATRKHYPALFTGLAVEGRRRA